MEDKLITLATFSSTVNAQIAKSVLDDGEIPAVLFDENTANLSIFHSGIVGGVRLMVPESVAAEAADLIRMTDGAQLIYEPDTASAEIDTAACPECQSKNVSPDFWWFLFRILSIFWLPALAKTKEITCNDCGAKWYESC